MTHVPFRTCVSCRKKQLKIALFRIVRTPKGEVKIEDVMNEKGRGVYLCKTRECVERAFHGKKKGMISHFLKSPVKNEVILAGLMLQCRR